MGSFRLAVGRRHLYRHCNFTGMFVETVFKSLHLSCGSELHVLPIFLLALTISSSYPEHVGVLLLDISAFPIRSFDRPDGLSVSNTLD